LRRGTLDALPADEIALAGQAAAKGDYVPANHQQVLLADDDEQILQAAALRLRSAGYDTVVAKGGSEVTDFVVKHRPHAIVLDVRMPHCDGLQVLAILRASAVTKSIPVVMLSASLSDRQRALQAGARFFLDKPYVGSKLIDAVNRAIAESVQK
jgi:CheY-like chemotaxis protein